MRAKLNPEQQKAVRTTEGRVLVLAGAGTGKTLVLTTRIAYLIQEKKVSPESILGLTFTNKAASEMRQRVAAMVSAKAAADVTLCTFHSWCMQILRNEIHHLGYTANFTLYTPSDVERLIKAIVRDELASEGEIPAINETLHQITLAKNLGLTPDEMPDKGNSWHEAFVKKIYRRLLNSMRAHNAVDFDNLLYLTVELFLKRHDILEKYQQRFRYIMIDEYQDTNPVQYRLASLLSAKYGNLFVVGDDDQSIYGWRGADIRNILEFENAAVIKLEQNYRSTPTILNAANALIQHNCSRHGKSLWSKNSDGKPLTVFHAPSEKDEAEAVVYRLVQMKKESGCSWNRFAILYRSNALSRHIEQVLMRTGYRQGTEWKRGIPYQVFGGTEFYERREVKDLLAYLRICANPKDQAAILRVVNVPRRGIGENSLDLLTSYSRQYKAPLWDILKQAAGKTLPENIQNKLNSKSLNGIASFVDIIETASRNFKHQSLSMAMSSFLETIDYKKAIKEDVKSEKMRVMKWDNVQELACALSEYESSSDSPTLLDFITSTPLNEEENRPGEKKDPNADKVQLMTFHSAKGLEFPVCFLVGLEDHILPHERSLKETGIEEERRLFYVALTRAKESLFLSMSQKRNRMGHEHLSKPSRFLYELPKELLNICRYDLIDSSCKTSSGSSSI